MTDYDDVRLPDGSSHPLRGVPQDVLDAARQALLEGNRGTQLPDGARVLDGDLESIADGIVMAIRATGWFAHLGDLETANSLVLARRALRRLADPTPMVVGTVTPADLLAAELEWRRDYAHRAWLGNRVDLTGRLPQIPPNWRMVKELPRFTTWEGGWHVLGLAADVRPGETVMVTMFSDPEVEETEVLIGDIVADRTVRHRGDTETTRYVIATVAKETTS